MSSIICPNKPLAQANLRCVSFLCVVNENMCAGLPRPRPPSIIVRIHRLVDETEATGGAHELLDAVDDFVVVGRRHGAHDDAHGPSHPGPKVRAAGGVEDRPEAKVRVRLAEDKVAGALVHGVRGGLETEMGNAQERGDIRIVLRLMLAWVVAGDEMALTIRLKEPKPSTSNA